MPGVSTAAPFISYAQHGEDVILWRALGDGTSRTYVDVGAFHPTHDSVTRALYERGWRGVNVEPQPDRLAAFLEERPEDVNLSVAIGETDGEIELNLTDNPGWASVLAPADTGADPEGVRPLTVPLRSLDSLFAELEIDHVDVLKIDVEGAEPAVVRGLLRGTVRPLVCVVEGVAPGVGRRAGDEAVALLVDAGYEHCLFDGLNHYLTTDPALRDALSTPAGPVDEYVPELVQRLMAERLQLHEAIAQLSVENLALRATASAAAPEEAPAEPSPEVSDDAVAADITVVLAQDPPSDPELHVHEASIEDAVDAAEAESDLPTPTPLPSLPELDDVDVDAVAPEPVRPALDPVVRAQRRRAAFARLLVGEPVKIAAAPTTPLARLLRLALLEHTGPEAVAILYRVILGREADTDGLALWSARVEAGESLIAVAHELAASQEASDRSAEDRARVRAELAAWESLVAVNELGVAAWRPQRIYTPGRVAEEIFVEALYEVTLQRRPDADELRFEVDKLRRGVGREWLLRAYAARPEAQRRFLGGAGGGLRGRWHRVRDRRPYLAMLRDRIAIAEARQVNQFLATLSAPGWGPPDLSSVTRHAPEER